MLLDELNMDCFGYILVYLPDPDIRSLFETNHKLSNLIISCIKGPPAKMVTLRNVSGKAEAIYHSTSKELIYSTINLNRWFYSHAIYNIVNLVISYSMEIKKLMKMFRKLQKQTTNGGIFCKWKQLNVIFTQNVELTKELADELCQFEIHSFACSAEHISGEVSLGQFLKACQKAENIWIMSPTFTTNFMDELQKWEYQGDSECSIILQNPSHEASIIELPPEEYIINFCNNFPSHKLLLSIVIDTEEFEPDTLPNYVQILSARLPEYNVTNRDNRLTIRNISMSSFELFAIAANILKTPSQIFFFDQEEEEEDSDEENEEEEDDEVVEDSSTEEEEGNEEE